MVFSSTFCKGKSKKWQNLLKFHFFDNLSIFCLYLDTMSAKFQILLFITTIFYLLLNRFRKGLICYLPSSKAGAALPLLIRHAQATLPNSAGPKGLKKEDETLSYPRAINQLLTLSGSRDISV